MTFPRPHPAQKATLVNSSPTPVSPNTTPPISVQLWTVRDHFDDLPGTLRRLTDIGFTQVEAWGFMRVPELAVALRDAGLHSPTGHATLIDGDLDETFAAASSMGIHTVIEPWTEPARWQRAEDVVSMAGELNAAAERAAGFGLRVGYHNHDHEFSTLLNGRPAFDLFVEHLDPQIALEIDVHMVQVGGQDPLDVLRRYADRVIAVHLLGEPTISTTASDDAAAVREIVPLAIPTIELNESQTDVFGVLAAAYPLLAAGRHTAHGMTSTYRSRLS